MPVRKASSGHGPRAGSLSRRVNRVQRRTDNGFGREKEAMEIDTQYERESLEGDMRSRLQAANQTSWSKRTQPKPKRKASGRPGSIQGGQSRSKQAHQLGIDDDGSAVAGPSTLEFVSEQSLDGGSHQQGETARLVMPLTASLGSRRSWSSPPKAAEPFSEDIRARQNSNGTWSYSHQAGEWDEFWDMPLSLDSSSSNTAFTQLYSASNALNHGSPVAGGAKQSAPRSRLAGAASEAANQRQVRGAVGAQTLEEEMSSDGASEIALQGDHGFACEVERHCPTLPARSCLRSGVRLDRYSARPKSLPLSFDGPMDQDHLGQASLEQLPAWNTGTHALRSQHFWQSGQSRGHAQKASAVSFAELSTDASLNSRPGTLRTDALGTLRTVGTHVTHGTAITVQTRDTTATTKTLFTRATTLSEFFHSQPFGWPLMVIAKPVFILTQVGVTLGLWLGTCGLDIQSRGGLELIADLAGQTDLRWSTDCEDHRMEAWRWYTYQFTHLGLQHILANIAMLLICIPLERFHGSVRLGTIFTAGVLGGACAYFLFDAHKSVVGMSGGNFALFGMYIADLATNWGRKKYKCLEMAVFSVFLVLILYEAGAFSLLDPSSDMLAAPAENKNVAHAVHAGGFTTGVLLTAGIGRLAKRHRTKKEQSVQVLALFMALLMVCVAVLWSSQWPPRNIFDAHPWCWTRKVYVGGTWTCAHCEDQACIEDWSKTNQLASGAGCSGIDQR